MDRELAIKAFKNKGIIDLDNYAIHHDYKNGVFQLINENIHDEFKHYGGYYFYK